MFPRVAARGRHVAARGRRRLHVVHRHVAVAPGQLLPGLGNFAVVAAPRDRRAPRGRPSIVGRFGRAARQSRWDGVLSSCNSDVIKRVTRDHASEPK